MISRIRKDPGLDVVVAKIHVARAELDACFFCSATQADKDMKRSRPIDSNKNKKKPLLQMIRTVKHDVRYRFAVAQIVVRVAS